MQTRHNYWITKVSETHAPSYVFKKLSIKAVMYGRVTEKIQVMKKELIIKAYFT